MGRGNNRNGPDRRTQKAPCERLSPICPGPGEPGRRDQHAIGMVLLDLDNASAYHAPDAGLRVRRRLVEDDQSGPSSRVELAETLMGLASGLEGRSARAGLDRWAQTAPLLARAVALQPDDPRALKDLVIIRAVSYEGKQRPPAPARRLLKLTSEPYRPAIVMELARLDQRPAGMTKPGDGGAMQFDVDPPVAQRPGDQRAWRELGIARAELGQPEMAATAFAQFLDLTPQSNDEILW